MKPFPRCADVTWGASKAVDQCGLVPSHRTAMLAAPGGCAQVSFTKLRPVILYAKLTCEVRDSALEKCVSITELDDQVSISVDMFSCVSECVMYIIFYCFMGQVVRNKEEEEEDGDDNDDDDDDDNFPGLSLWTFPLSDITLHTFFISCLTKMGHSPL